MTTDKSALIKSKEFEAALDEGAEYKKNIVTTYKQQNKDNYSQFYEIMLSNRDDIQKILDTKRSKRTDEDKEILKQFKRDITQTYNQVREFLTPEKVEDGKQTKLEKLASKLAAAFDMLEYIDKNVLNKQLALHGLKIVSVNNLPEKMDNDKTRSSINSVFECAVSLRQKVENDNNHINDNIFTSKVPLELQYDKDTNNTGLKAGDFRKLVDMKTKLLLASTAEAKEKVDEKIEQAAADKQFEVARAELVRDKLTDFSS